MRKTVVVQIGNSDNRLAQSSWGHFCHATRNAVAKHCFEMHFSGGSDYDAPWQNACFVGEIDEEKVDELRKELKTIRASYGQESVAMICGETEFV